MSDVGSAAGDLELAAHTAPERRLPRRRQRRHLVVGALVVAVLAAGLIAADRLRQRDTDATASGWRRATLPALSPPGEAADVGALAAPAAGQDRWWAVGDVLDPATGRHTATAWSAPEGRAWQRSTIDPGPDALAAGVAQRDGLVVAVGMLQGRDDRDGAVWSSRDGTTWRRVAVRGIDGRGDQDLRAVAAGTLGFVATGRDRGPMSSVPTVFLSTDGSSWRRVGEAAFPEGAGVSALTVGPAGAVAVGWVPVGEQSQGAVWWSKDGEVWARGTLGAGDAIAVGASGPGGLPGVLSTVTAVADGFVAMAQEGEGSERRPVVWRSADGAQWRRTTSPALAELPNQKSTRGVVVVAAAGTGPYFAVGGGRSQQVWRSPDGSEWLREAVPDELARSATLSLVAARGDTAVVVGTVYGGVNVWRRDATQPWVKVSEPSVFPVSAPPGHATLARSPRGLTLFADRPDDAAPTRFGGTAVWTSTDGRSWRAEPDPAGQMTHASLGPVAAWSGGLVVGGDIEDERGDGFVRAMVWTSADGVTWQRAADQPGWNVPGNTTIILSVAPLGTGLVAVGIGYSVVSDLDAHVWTSADGRTWTQVPDQPAWRGGGDQALSGVCPLPGGGVVAVGYTGAGADQIAWAWTSTDGQTWSVAKDEGAAALGGTDKLARACVSTPTGVVAAASQAAPGGRDAAVWSSPDGRSWAERSDPSRFGGQGAQAVTALAADGSRVVAVGFDDDRAAVWFSLDGGVRWRRVADDRALFGGFTAYRANGVAIVGDRIVVSGTGAGGIVVWDGPLPRK